MQHKPVYVDKIVFVYPNVQKKCWCCDVIDDVYVFWFVVLAKNIYSNVIFVQLDQCQTFVCIFSCAQSSC